jgi:hypothetical protein
VTGGRGEARPYRVYWTRQEFEEAMLHFVGERVARARRAQLKAEKRAEELEAEVEELRRQFHTGGTQLR